MSTFQTDGAALAYELTGTGPVFVQLHGLTSSAWREHRSGLDMTLNLQEATVLRYDARGHGSSTGRRQPADYLWSQLGDDLLALLDEVAPGRQVHAAGPSMGSATLLYAACQQPERFTTLTLLVPPTAWSTRQAQAQGYLNSADLVEEEGIGAFIRVGESVLPPPALAGRQRERVPAVSQELLPSVLRGAAQADLPPLEVLKDLDLPVQILAWTGDHSHPVSTAEKLADTLPNARLGIAETPEDLRSWPARVSRFVDRWR